MRNGRWLLPCSLGCTADCRGITPRLPRWAKDLKAAVTKTVKLPTRRRRRQRTCWVVLCRQERETGATVTCVKANAKSLLPHRCPGSANVGGLVHPGQLSQRLQCCSKPLIFYIHGNLGSQIFSVWWKLCKASFHEHQQNGEWEEKKINDVNILLFFLFVHFINKCFSLIRY